MSEKIATLKKEGDISIITLDDGKANVFSSKMSQQVNDCLDQDETEKFVSFALSHNYISWSGILIDFGME